MSLGRDVGTFVGTALVNLGTAIAGLGFDIAALGDRMVPEEWWTASQLSEEYPDVDSHGRYEDFDYEDFEVARDDWYRKWGDRV